MRQNNRSIQINSLEEKKQRKKNKLSGLDASTAIKKFNKERSDIPQKSVMIDSKTSIIINIDRDPEEARIKYLARLNKV